jgi:hypothetical protein
MTRTFVRPERKLSARAASAASNSTAVTWPAGPTQLGQDRAIIARAGADMDDALTGLRRERLEQFGVHRRAAVVDPARRVESDERSW